jgi:hypothetical protein
LVNKEYMTGKSARWDVRVNARIQSQVRVHARTNRQVLGKGICQDTVPGSML